MTRAVWWPACWLPDGPGPGSAAAEPPVAIGLTVDEEVGGRGSTRMAQDIRPRYVSLPRELGSTSLLPRPVLCTRGSMCGEGGSWISG